MPEIIIKTRIKADIQTCFDLSLDIDFHTRSLKHSNEKAIAGKTTGLIKLGESVTWQATHFGINQKLTSKITEMNPPHYFVDEMVKGIFKSFRHEHHFKSVENNTILTDKFMYVSPFGILGKLADKIVLKRYLTRLLKTRNTFLKKEAEIRTKLV
ncbi:SRPBCC family protein [Ichthyenterobacterium sp. W332]|uniref:SRPBCC family protein n=1 Tax=Microcosmobacter mediterraneus TaxID=3075607 RepID=A0ABU2YR62_9FLAO|nr:SRPBCC family protein [Ichthyenterobacterium sp. W332]MDT0559558.1 SRPBCC family protein [Ichthyenterobacterium sp. W332]